MTASPAPHPTHQPTRHPTHPPTQHPIACAIATFTLTASATALAAVLLFRAISPANSVSLPFERAALAGDAVILGDMTLATISTDAEDAIAIIDNRTQRLLLYRLQNRRRLDYLQSVSLQRVFVEARATYAAGER